MKKITALVMLICLVALPLAACTARKPATTTTNTTTTRTTTATVTETTDTVTVTDTAEVTTTMTGMAPEANQGNMTRYLHGLIDSVTDTGMILSEVPVYDNCEIEVSASTQLVGVTQLSELEQGLHVIVGYTMQDMSLLPNDGNLAADISEAASDIASGAADIMDDMTASPSPSASPDTKTQASPSVTTSMSGEKLVAVTVELAEPLPKLTGNVTEVNADGFDMEGTSEGMVHVVAPEGTLMVGMDKPAKGDTVTVVYNGQIGKANPARVSAVSVTKEEKAPK